ncbi:MAG: RdgB/HAM1 family non-canonical purine NTP pyrophosphatase [Rickettsiales bacterium]|nr:RdgB/HAM1 family non-canonical purine NTP pyrophosphatase [Rickettsiales bacterium]
MPFPPADRRLVIATHNAGKLREIGDILAPFALNVASAGSLGISEPEETGLTFEENAALKALHSAVASQGWALADDSGLEVTALDNAPGIYSARWAGASKDFSSAMMRIQQELTAKNLQPEGAAARFVCVLALASPTGQIECFRGEVEGHLTFPARGEHGFGYDPIFIAHGMTQTFAEIMPQEKHQLSHRARAFAKLLAYMERTT